MTQVFAPEDDEPFVIVEGQKYYTTAAGEAICPECGATRSTERIADHMASEHDPDEDAWDDEEGLTT